MMMMTKIMKLKAANAAYNVNNENIIIFIFIMSLSHKTIFLFKYLIFNILSSYYLRFPSGYAVCV